MKFGTITRGSHKIYIALDARCPEGGTIAAISISAGGDEVPALVLERDATKGEYVLVLPLLAATQTVHVVAYAKDGTVEDEITQRIDHFSSAFAAKINTFIKNPEANEIRNFDRNMRNDVSIISPNMICGAGYTDGSELVRMNIEVPCTDKTNRFVPFKLRVLDRQGKELDVKHFVSLGDSFDRPVPHSDFSRRSIVVSFRKDRNIDWFIVWVQFESNLLPASFTCMDTKRTKEKRAEFEICLFETGVDAQYEDWFILTQRASPAVLDAQREAHFEIEPLFSVIVPLYKTPLSFFEEMSRSVLDQTYSKLELILVNASPEDGDLCSAVQACADSDDRVRVVTLDKNYGISINTNEGIKIASGDFLSFFDHDDVLELNLLYEYVMGLNEYPETDLFYCDEDKLKNGHYVEGFLKPDFGWEYLMTCNYVCHLLTVRKSVVDTIELSEDKVTGAQDWDMTMKVAEKARNIFHARKVLYHWRAHEKSVAMGADTKQYTHHAGEIAIQDHFDRIGVKAVIHDNLIENMHRIEYIMPNEKPLVSIIIPSKDQATMLENCLNSIWEKSTYPNFEIIIVENNSTEDETFALYERLQKEHDDIRVETYEGDFNFSAICNLGAESAHGDMLLFLNNDTEIITSGWIEELIGPLQRSETSVVGARLLYKDGTIQHDGVVVPRMWPFHVSAHLSPDYVYYFGITQCMRDVLAVTGACMLVRRSDFELVNGFDEKFAVAYNDVDLCLRLVDKGKRIIMNPHVKLYHFESVSRGSDKTRENKVRFTREMADFQNRWAKYLANGDPYYGTHIIPISPYYALEWS